MNPLILSIHKNLTFNTYIMAKSSYKPKIGSPQFLTLRELYEDNPHSIKSKEIRERIMFNPTHPIYKDRESYAFMFNVIYPLMGRKLIKRVKRGYYQITSKGFDAFLSCFE